MRNWPSSVVEPVVLPESVLTEWALSDAVPDSQPGNLLPSRVAYHALLAAERPVREVIEATLHVGYRPRRSEVVQVPKLDRTTRPASDLPVDDQLIYTALLKLLRARVPEGFVTFTGERDHSYEAFETYPLTVEGANYVLEADVAGFYQYIDHERLAYELIGLTGRADVVEPLLGLIEGWIGSPRGIPQGPPGSYVLADIYMAPVDRNLSRAGYSFSRYSDDFRVAGRTWGEVKRAQMELEDAFYHLGLVVAANKLRTPKIDTYRRVLDRVGDPRLQRVVIREAIGDLETEEYVPGRVTRVAVTPAQTGRAAEVFEDQIAAERVDLLATRLLRRALQVLGSTGDSRALAHFRPLMSRYPHLAPNASAYLQLLQGTDNEANGINALVEWLTARRYRHPWQEGWMLHAAVYATNRHELLAPPALRILESARKPWFARGQAALVLATHGSLPPQRDFVALFEQAPEATRPDLIAAVRIAEPPWASRFLGGAADRPLSGAVVGLPPDMFRDWI